MESISANRRVDTAVPTLLAGIEVSSPIGETFSLQIGSQHRTPVPAGIDGVDDGPFEGIAHVPTGPRPAPHWRSSCSSAKGAAESDDVRGCLLGQDGTSMPARPSQDESADRAGNAAAGRNAVRW